MVDVWDQISKRVAQNHPKFIRLGQGPNAEHFPQHRREMIAEIVKDMFAGRAFNLPNANVAGDLERAAAQVMGLYLEGYQVLAGVPKKGLAILREIVDRLGIPAQVYNSTFLRRRDVAAKKILIFDDMVHDGQTLVSVLTNVFRLGPASVAATTLWASQAGIDVVKSKGFQNFKLEAGLPVSERFFWLIFQVYVSPMLFVLKGGAVSNRPFDALRLRKQSWDSTRVAEAFLGAISELPGVEIVVENPPLDGIAGDTFHGEVEVGEAIWKNVLPQQKSTMEGVEYAKVRLFIHLAEPLRIHLCAVFCPLGVAPGGKLDAPLAEMEELDSALSCKMLDELWKQLEPKLQETGLEVVSRLQHPIGDFTGDQSAGN